MYIFNDLLESVQFKMAATVLDTQTGYNIFKLANNVP